MATAQAASTAFPGSRKLFVATQATRLHPESPLIFDVVMDEKVYLVAFVLAERVNGQTLISSRNNPIWSPLKALVGNRVVHSRGCESLEAMEAVFEEMAGFDSGACFLVSCDDMVAIATMVRKIDPLRTGSRREH